MSLIDNIDSDLKQALLSGDKLKTETLKGVKSALQYAQTSPGSKVDSNDDNSVLLVLQKESKKRQEASEAYEKAGDQARSESEKSEQRIIDQYLPKKLEKEEIKDIVDKVINDNNLEKTPKNMGQIIKLVRDQVGVRADGATIASAVKEKVSD